MNQLFARRLDLSEYLGAAMCGLDEDVGEAEEVFEEGKGFGVVGWGAGKAGREVEALFGCGFVET